MNVKKLQKPLKARFEIEGASNNAERLIAGEMLLNTYNLTCDIVNNGGIDKFNSEWDRLRADATDDEYDKAYCRYFKSIADGIVDIIAKAHFYKTVYKLKERHPCILNPEQGYCTIYGYKETRKES